MNSKDVDQTQGEDQEVYGHHCSAKIIRPVSESAEWNEHKIRGVKLWVGGPPDGLYWYFGSL